MNKTTELRPRVVKDYVERHEAKNRRFNQYVNKRNELHKRLNEDYGFSGLGKYSRDKTYLDKYEEIENHYRSLIDKEWQAEVDKDKATLSVFEYLLFDNASTEAKQALLHAANEHIDQNWHDFVRVRAHAEIDRWRTEERGLFGWKGTIGEIEEKIKHEERDFPNRAARCRNICGIGKLNLAGRKAIFDFKRWYVAELKEYFMSLKA